MRKFLMILVLFSGITFAQNSQRPEECKKTYVLLNQIAFSQNNILVQLDNQWLPTESLHVDANGIFVIKDEKEKDWLHWKCPICGHINSIADNRCVKCRN